MTQNAIVKNMSDSAVVRWSVLVLVALTMFFSHLFIDILSPLKTLLETTVDWNSTIFGTYASSSYFLNVFAGFLILAGVILDRMGVRFTAVLAGSLMVCGALIKVFALSETFNTSGGWLFNMLDSEAFPASAKLACVGFAIFGTGSEMAGITVSRIVVKWFRGKEMALAMGLEMALARFSVFVVFWISPWISQYFSYDKYLKIQAPVMFATALLCVGLVLYIVYGVLDRKLTRQLEEQQAEIGEEKEEPFRFSDLRLIFANRIFWIVALLCVLYYSAIFPFQKFATEMLHSNISMPVDEASHVFSMFPLGAMLITPLIGGYIDYKGKGASMLVIGAVMMFACHLTFALFPFENFEYSTRVGVAMTSIVILGISFSLVPAALWPALPKIIDEKVLGSAYSAIFFIQNIGLMTVPILIGRILDVTNVGKSADEPKDYLIPMLIFSSFGVAAFFLSFLLKYEDKRKGYGLELPNKTKN